MNDKRHWNCVSLRGGAIAEPLAAECKFYLCLGPVRGMHFRVRTRPVFVIFVPDISLTCPAGQVPSSTLTRCPRRNSTMSFSFENCCARVVLTRMDIPLAPRIRTQRNFSMRPSAIAYTMA